MEAFLVPDKWIPVRLNSHRDSAKTDDRRPNPRDTPLLTVVTHAGTLRRQWGRG